MRSFQLIGGPAGVDFFHRDAVLHRADQRAQIAAHAFFFDDARHVHAEAVGIFLCCRRLVRLDALVRAVLAGDVAELAADAEFGIDLRDDFVIQIEVAPIPHVRHGAAAEILDGAEAMIVHVLREAVDHILDDAESVVHGGGANLNGGGAEAMCSAASFQ